MNTTKPTVIFSPRSRVEELLPEIARLLAVLDHPEAWVSDESTFLDFISMPEFPTREAAQTELDRLCEEVGYPHKLDVTETLVDAAERATRKPQ